MPASREDLHRLIDQLSPEGIDQVQEALVVAAARVAEDLEQHTERARVVNELTPEELHDRAAELAADLHALGTRLRESEWISPDVQTRIDRFHVLVAEAAADTDTVPSAAQNVQQEEIEEGL